MGLPVSRDRDSHKHQDSSCRMQMTRLNTESGYIPAYTRTELTDDLHEAFGFRTGYEFIAKSAMRTIIKNTSVVAAF